MLKEDKNAHFAAGFMRRRLVSGRLEFPAISRGAYRAVLHRQADDPVPVGVDERRTWWMFRDRIYWEDDELEPDEVKALLVERERRLRRRIERAKDLMEADAAGGPRRESISEDLRREVFRRDGGRCVRCASAELLQFDHIIPVALGGASTRENLQLLCASCNREKGASL